MARKTAVKVTKDLVGKVNPDGTITTKVAKGKTVKTANGSTLAGGKFAGTVASTSKVKATSKRNQKIVDELEDWDDFEDDFDVDTVDTVIDEEPVADVHLYVTKDGIVGNVLDDGLQIIDTSGIHEDDLEELADAPADEREELADALRSGRAYIPTKHYFNDSGDYGSVRDLKIVDCKELTKSEMNSLLDSDNPYSEASNYDSSGYNIVSVLRQVRNTPHNGNQDDLLDDDMIEEGTSYR